MEASLKRSEAGDKITILEKEIEQEVLKSSSLTEQLAVIRGQMEGLTQDLASKETQISAMNSSHLAREKLLKEDLEVLNSSKDQLQTRLAVTEDKLSAATLALTQAKQEVQSHKSKVAEAQLRLEECQEEHSSLIAKMKMGHVDQVARINCDVDRYRKEARGTVVTHRLGRKKS